MSVKTITITRHISREDQQIVSDYGLDPESAYSFDLNTPFMRQYQIGDSDSIAFVDIYKAAAIVFHEKLPMQKIIDGLSDEALKRKYPDDYIADELERKYDAIPETGTDDEPVFVNMAVKYLKDHEELIKPREVNIKIDFLWEWPDGSYRKEKPEQKTERK